jgi:capsular polysaccharide transport system permease protein
MDQPDAHESWADLIQLQGAPQSMPVRLQQRRRWAGPHISRRLRSFIFLVILPTLMAGTYFGLIAPHRYLAEAKFIVRKPASISSGMLTPSTPDQTVQSGDEDAYAVRDFILSRDGLQAALNQGGLRGALAKSGNDPLWRFPGPLLGHTQEQLFRYYLDLVSVTPDVTTGVSTLRVQAFDPSDARRLAAELTDAAEALLNRLQTRARQDAIRVAAVEVERTRGLATAAQQALTSFRTRENMVDPTMLAQTVLNTITELSLHVVEASAQLDMLRRASGSSPQIAPLRSRVAALEAQIDRERATLAGNNLSYAPKIAEYERLVLLRDFAVRNFISALTALETARLEALHQRVYLERVVQPREADQPAYPHRVLCVLVVFGIGLLIYRILRPAAPVVPSLRAQFR